MKGEIDEFIREQQEYLIGIDVDICWSDDKWNVSNWIPNRGQDKFFDFRSIRSNLNSIPAGQPLPKEFSSFIKALAIYLRRTRRTGFMSIRNYINELRRLYVLVMLPRKEQSPVVLTRWHFEKSLQLREEENYKNIYDAAANIKLVADAIDELNLLSTRISFQHSFQPNRSYHSNKRLSAIFDDNERDDTKTPSMQLFEAYAQCTNNPINENEEILLRTIDLLITLGQRGNEVTVIPYDCWLELEKYDKNGSAIKDANGNKILEVGIKYYAEKNFQPKIHYLSDQDVPFAKRAVERLKELTQEARIIAKWQEDHAGKVWPENPNELIDDDSIMNRYIHFKGFLGLHRYIDRLGIPVIKSDINSDRNSKIYGRYKKRRYYRSGELESALLKKLPDHFDFKINHNNSLKTVLKTSEILSIRFEGAYRFKERGTSLIKLFPHRTTLAEINSALGAVSANESIFDRRQLTEKDGSRLKITSHAFRHWRNTIYQLCGMSNVQQALALGRKDLAQNSYYQHQSPQEKTDDHRNFVNYNDNIEKVSFLRKGIMSGTIRGPLTTIYEKIKAEQSSKDAEEFLKVHASALHVTPFGGCTHDFSQSPCMKHLQCWNGCSNLHRTNDPKETERLHKLRENFKQVYSKLSVNQGKDSIWVKDLKQKIENLDIALKLIPEKTPKKIFPNGKQLNLSQSSKTSSIK
ncbi:hypothetical protein [Marivirga harenae]|uniref:hypothetical protein n=1 Tax=Marivirga harenae TaxID=2010992 RepID=UPI0026E01ABD|nr:hypothetical protein [Marivirga harenae]WKV11460.1 hypothetical protein Q3Y49_14735 [Marivirga harenae]